MEHRQRSGHAGLGQLIRRVVQMSDRRNVACAVNVETHGRTTVVSSNDSDALPDDDEGTKKKTP